MNPMINMLSDSVRTSSPHAKKWNDDFALAFWADVVEAVFRCRVRQVDSIADRFVQRWKMPNRDKIRWLPYLAMRMVMKNAGTKAENEMYCWPPVNTLIHFWIAAMHGCARTFKISCGCLLMGRIQY